MNDKRDREQEESRRATGASRRSFLKGMGAVTAGGVMATVPGTAMRQGAFAADGEPTNTLVVVNLRGGADGLSMVVPYRDTGYVTARPHTAIPPATLLQMNDTFGLHPSLAPLQDMWKARKISAVHAVGQPTQNLSHFSATVDLEEANPGASDWVGWINRLAASTDPASLYAAAQIGETVPHTAVYGPQSSLATVDVDAIQVSGATNAMAQRLASLDATWDQAAGPLAAAVRQSLDTAAQWSGVVATPADPQNGAVYPNTDFGDALAQSARVIRSNVGVQVLSVDHVGWDMHDNVGTLSSGQMIVMINEFATGLQAFFTDLGSLGDNVTVVTLTEFGRRVEENGDGGLDHGWGGVMFVLGAGVKGGYYGKFPGCSETQTSYGNLKVTTDYRSVLTEVVRSRFPAADLSAVFPGFTPKKVGAMAA